MYLLKENKIIKIGAKVISPFILLFGFYVQFNGTSSTGGGFQSGIIFTIPFILYIILFGEKAFNSKLFSIRFFRTLASIGVLFYLLTGVLTTLCGGNFLEYNVLINNKHLAQELGVSLVETGVCMVVFSSMMIIFMFFYKKSNH